MDADRPAGPPGQEAHRSGRSAWLRAAVLGANDGVVSTASLVVGVAATGSDRAVVLVAGLAGLVGGALSMAVGEYVSVSAQRDAELADLALEARHLEHDPEGELRELTEIYRRRGLGSALARDVARALMDHDALAAHARDELHFTPGRLARPLQAAGASAAAFALGAALPLLVVLTAPMSGRVPATVGAALVALAVLGAVAARLGGAPVPRAMLRTLVGSGLAMGLTFAIGSAFGGIT